MKANGVLLSQIDNVITTTEMINPTHEVNYFREKQLLRLRSCEEIPIYHKVAIKSINKGEKVIKYGQVIGIATVDILQGAHVAHHNIESLPRNYDAEMGVV